MIEWFVGSCNHVRALNYFTESIKGSMFNATKCQSYNDYSSGTVCQDNPSTLMGQHVSLTWVSLMIYWFAMLKQF
jgi:hypothetical protein